MSAVRAVKRPTHLRLVHPARPLLTRAQLAHFAEPKTWDEIVLLDPEMSPADWRAGIIDSDEAGDWRFLTFAPAAKSRRRKGEPPASGVRLKGSWKLTARGAEYIRSKR